jgi:ArsR family metal-binding transcriptional regulator
VLDEIENGTIHNLEFVELNACNGGCVGGTLNVENPYIAKARLRSLRKYLPISRNRIEQEIYVPECVVMDDFDNILRGISSSALAEDRMTAIAKMSEVENIYKSLPHLDCGSCGAPTCHALAEDIIKGEACEVDCLIKLRDNASKID